MTKPATSPLSAADCRLPGRLVDPLLLSRALIERPSITPDEAGTLGLIEDIIRPLGFACHRLRFEAPGAAPVENLYARVGAAGPNFCFAGHVDVVPPGSLEAWTVAPFAAEVLAGRLYGRGASDMKAAIACFIAAAARFLAERGDDFPNSLSLLLTADEEGPAVNGTVKVVEWLRNRGETLDACLVGEPTNPHAMGEMIKIGRRGSLNARLTVYGVQGHAAYPENALNPIPQLMQMLTRITETPLDQGSRHFPPSTVAITSIDVGNPVTNVIPAQARALLNIRFNDRHTAESLKRWLTQRCSEAGGRFELETECSGEAFLCSSGPFTTLVCDAVRRVTGRSPEISTTGGTSDARFIKDLCPVVEFGMVGETAHKTDESIDVADIGALTDIYRAILHGYFDRRCSSPASLRR